MWRGFASKIRCTYELALEGEYMGHSTTGKAVSNESNYPYIVEIAVAEDKLDVELSRQMMDFHKSRKIQARHGR